MTTTNLKISIKATIFTAVLCVIYFLSRLGFSNPLIDIFKVFGLSCFVLYFPGILVRAIRFFQPKVDTQNHNENLYSVFAITIISISGLFTCSFQWQYILIAMGYVFLVISLYHFFKAAVRSDLTDLIGIIIFALGGAAVCWEGRHLSPLFFEMLAIGEFSTDIGTGIDTLYHMSIAQMIKTYNIPTLGIDQLIPIKYHYGSHFILAQISKVLRLPVLTIYQLAYPVIFLSLFIQVFLRVVLQLRKIFGIEERTPVVFWIVIIAGFFGILPVSFKWFLLERAGLRLDAIWVSESYLLSLIFFLTIISILASMLYMDNQKQLKLMLYLLIITVVSGFLKISTMTIAFAILGYVFVRLKQYRRLASVLFAMALILLGLLVFTLAEGNNGDNGGMQMQFLHTYETYIHTNFIVFIVLYYFFAIAVTSLFIVKDKLYIKANFVNAFKIRSHLPLEILIVIVVAGFLPGALIKISGGSGLYFSEIQYWISLLLILVFLPIFDDYFNSIAEKLSSSPWRLLMLIKPIAICVMTVIALYNVYIKICFLVDNNLYTRRKIIQYPMVLPKRGDDRVIDFRKPTIAKLQHGYSIFTSPVQDSIDSIEPYNLLKSVSALDTLATKHESIIFVRDYSKFSEYYPCYKYPFLFPALSGIATLEGFDMKACAWILPYGYNFGDYAKTERSFYSASEENICDRLKESSLRSIILYNLYKRTYRIEKCR